MLVAIRADADLEAAARRAADLPPLSLGPVRAYRYAWSGSAVLCLRIKAPSPGEVAAIHALADGDRIAIAETDRWSRPQLEVLVYRVMPRLDHAGDHASIADALRALAAPVIRRAKIRHSTGGRTIAGCIERGGPCVAA